MKSKKLLPKQERAYIDHCEGIVSLVLFPNENKHCCQKNNYPLSMNKMLLRSF